jgi:hypothetical protein
MHLPIQSQEAILFQEMLSTVGRIPVFPKKKLSQPTVRRLSAKDNV